MKKWKIGIISTVLIIALVGGSTAMAAGPGRHHGWNWNTNTPEADSTVSTGVCSWTGSCWWDTDGDGIRDDWSGTCADADGDGICDVCGRTVHNYTDANGDGICDHYGIGNAVGSHHSGHWNCH